MQNLFGIAKIACNTTTHFSREVHGLAPYSWALRARSFVLMESATHEASPGQPGTTAPVTATASASMAAPAAASASAAPSESPLNLIAFSLSVGALVLAAMTLASHTTLVIPLVVVCLTLSLLGAATKQPHALLGWIAALLSAIALTVAVVAAVSG